MRELVTCKDLTKRFGNHTALDHHQPFPGFRENHRTARVRTEAERRRCLKLLNGLLTPSEG